MRGNNERETLSYLPLLSFSFLSHFSPLREQLKKKKKIVHECSHMHISLCPDTGTPLCPPSRLRGTRLIHLQSSGGERRATGGSSTGRKEVEEESFGIKLLIWQRICTLQRQGKQRGGWGNCSQKKHLLPKAQRQTHLISFWSNKN